MNIIDAHHHLWIPQQTDPDIGYGWLRDIGALKPFGDPTPIQRDYELPEFLSESREHVVSGCVFLQTDGGLPDPVKETQWVAETFSRHALPHAIVGFVDLNHDTADRVLERHLQLSAFRGVRQILSRLDDQPALCFAPAHYLRSPVWRENLALLAEHDLSFDLQLYPEQMHEAAEVLSRWPDITLVVDHAGSPHDVSDEGFSRWKAGVTALAELPNCMMKLSGFGMFDRHWSAASIEPGVRHCLQTFHASRTLFGSNFPVDKLMASYDDVVHRVVTALRRAAAAEDLDVEATLQDVFVNTARRTYRLPMDTG